MQDWEATLSRAGCDYKTALEPRDASGESRGLMFGGLRVLPAGDCAVSLVLCRCSAYNPNPLLTDQKGV